MARADKGSIKELGKGRWLVRVSGGNDPVSGKRIRLSRTIRGTKKDALAERTRMLVEVGDIGYIRGCMTFGEFVEEVFLPRKRQQVERDELRENSYHRLCDNLRKCGQPIWEVPLNKMAPFHVETCMARVGGPSARFNVYSDLRAVWGKAMTWGFTPKGNDIFDAIEPPRKPVPDIETASTELLAKILQAFRGHSVEPIVLMMAGCGLRCSEACGLDWEHFDWDEGTVAVTRGFHKVGGKTMFLPPKTVLSGATVSMPEMVRKRMYEISHDSESGVVLSGAISVMGANGGRARRHPGSASEAYRAHYRKMLPDATYICIKNLRHSHATILLENGEDIALVSKRLRHSNLATTYRRYIKPGLSADRHSSGLFDSAMSSALGIPVNQDEADRKRTKQG